MFCCPCAYREGKNLYSKAGLCFHSFLTSALDGMGVVSFIPLQLEVRRTNPGYQLSERHIAETLIKAKHSVSTNIMLFWRR